MATENVALSFALLVQNGLTKTNPQRNYNSPELCIVWQFALFKLFRGKAFFMSATVCFPVTKLASPNSFTASAVL